jgi:hypothetical protein
VARRVGWLLYWWILSLVMGTETDTSKLKTKLAIADFWEFWRTKADGYGITGTN